MAVMIDTGVRYAWHLCSYGKRPESYPVPQVSHAALPTASRYS